MTTSERLYNAFLKREIPISLLRERVEEINRTEGEERQRLREKLADDMEKYPIKKKYAFQADNVKNVDLCR